MLILTGLFPLSAQDFGIYPPGMHWQQINTPSLRAIFPRGLEQQASQVANIIRYEDEHNRTSIGSLTKKLNLVLNNQGVISNGYVGIMPYKSEFYTIPMQNSLMLGTGDWLSMLSIHEYRHALQYTNLLKGFNEIAYSLTGEGGWGLMMNLTVPGWFFEGDAVATETALTTQGRGRLPSFTQLTRSIYLENKRLSYMKASNGSYRQRVPDEYEMGYLLCSYGRENYGNDFWFKVLNRTSWLRGIVYPFSDAVLLSTGMTTRKFYRKAMDDFKSAWQEEEGRIFYTGNHYINQKSRTVTDYQFPVFMADSCLFAYKKSYKEIGTIIKLYLDGREEKVCTLGITQDPYFSASGNLISWSEITWSPRYQAVSYSDIVVYDSITGKRSRLTNHQRFFSPAISPNRQSILVFEADPFNKNSLKILDIRSGEVIRTLPNPGNLYYTYPKWLSDGTAIISSARTPAGQMVIIRQNISTGRIEKLTEELNNTIGEVISSGDRLYFSCSLNGRDDIYCLDTANRSFSRLTMSKYGAFHPAISPDGQTMVYSDFQSNGYQMAMASSDELLWQKTEPVPLHKTGTLNFNYFNEENGPILDRISQDSLPSHSYSPLSHLFRLHSWILNPTTSSIGLLLISDNILNDLHLEGGPVYYFNEQAPGISAAVKYGGLFPVVGAEFSRVYRPEDKEDNNDKIDTTGLNNSFSLTAELPLNLTRGMYWRSLDIQAGYDFISSQDLVVSDFEPLAPAKYFHSISGLIRYTSSKKKAYQNITTPLGFGVDLAANQSVNQNKASRIHFIGDFAARGIFRNQNLLISAGFKNEKQANDYLYLDDFIYPRGYIKPAYDQYFTLQATYHLPLCYPDLGFAGIFYISRIRSGLFADMGYGAMKDRSLTDPTKIVYSAGMELMFDTKWFNVAELPLGVRITRLGVSDPARPGKKWKLEFFIPVLRL